MRYQWPELAKRGWIGARILAVGAALVLFAFGHRFEAQAQTASVGEACFTYGYCAVVGYAPYYGVYSGYCSSVCVRPIQAGQAGRGPEATAGARPRRRG